MGLSANEKNNILNKIKPLTKEDAIEDFDKLKKINCSNINDVSKGSRVGANFVDYFTIKEKLETIGAKGMTFYDFWEKKSVYEKKTYIKKLLNYFNTEKRNQNIYQKWFRLFNIYFGSINIFKPIIAMEIYCRFKPLNILDFTMGWGGRLVGACALNIHSYTGIDLNKNLEQPYNEMVKVLKEHSTTNIKLIFKSALDVDYSKLNYDLVLTSPPYYNIEKYRGQPIMTKEDWNKDFYEPLFTKTFKYLKNGGHYCLNVPKEVYNNVCIKVLGKATLFIPLYKNLRNKNDTYKEYIYVWIKR
jgi:hypothetical protein